MGATPEMVMSERGLDQLIAELRSRGYRTLGPVVRDGAVVHDEVSSTDDLPRGWHDHQAPGHYRLDHGEDAELFGWAVGPTSWKATFFPPEEVAWSASVEGGDVVLTVPDAAPGPVALIGVRPCELSALGTLDRVLVGGAVVTTATRPAGRTRSSWPSSAVPRPERASARRWGPARPSAPVTTSP